jgi:hypothetical protein
MIMTSDSEQMARQVGPAQLAELLARSDPEAPLWRPDELGALLQHQLCAPVEVDLGTLPPSAAQQLKGLSDAEGLLLKSYADLFRHPRPPLRLLRLVKDFAKAASAAPAGPVPREVAQVLYYASIAAALVRWGERITSLDDEALRCGFRWVQRLSWAEAETTALMASAERRVGVG